MDLQHLKKLIKQCAGYVWYVERLSCTSDFMYCFIDIINYLTGCSNVFVTRNNNIAKKEKSISPELDRERQCCQKETNAIFMPIAT